MKVLKRIKQELYAIRNAVLQTEATGLECIGRLLDILYCRIFLHCHYSDYVRYKFHRYKNRYRKYFILTYHRCKKFNLINTKGITCMKYAIYERLKNCYAREAILIPDCGEERFLAFVKKHSRVICKENTGSLGKNIELFTYINDEQAIEFYRKTICQTICEELIVQHDSLSEFNPSSVNTIRVVSLLKEDRGEILSATLKTGKDSNSLADNVFTGGLAAQVDIKTGIVTSYGQVYSGAFYAKHPSSGKMFLGFQVPNWDSVCALVMIAHQEIPECSLLGWDIAVTPNGACVVETNNMPDVKLMQIDGIPKGKELFKFIKSHKHMYRKRQKPPVKA